MSEARVPETKTKIKSPRYSFLLASLLLMIVVYPFLETLGRGQLLFSMFFTFILLNVVYTLARRSRIFYAVAGLTFVAIVIDWAGNIMNLRDLPLLRVAVSVILLAFVEIVILRDVLRAEKVTADKVFGGVCVYLILGIQCAILYAALGNRMADAFNVPLEQHGPMSQMLYFSFVTMTTLGYGDISALSTPARVLASLQALLGQLYLTVLVARLVALQITHER